MQVRRLLALSLISLNVVSPLCVGVAQQRPDQPATQDFKAGQVWSYKTAPGAEESTVLILKVEPGKKANIVHIRIEDIPVAGCGSLHIKTSIEHLAITEKALRKSATRLIKDNVEIPESYFEAYKEWQKGEHTITKGRLAEVALPMPVCPIMNDRRTTA